MTKYARELAPAEGVLPASLGSRCHMAIPATIDSLLLIIILVIALTFPYFGYVLALTGSLLKVNISSIFPCAFYIKICRSRLSRPALALNVAFIAAGQGAPSLPSNP
eukprot:Gb_27630 [translate_table: standard]